MWDRSKRVLTLHVLFQTVNTAARMESSGEPNRIHVSKKTAELIQQAGKGYVAAASLISRMGVIGSYTALCTTGNG
jgi:class 3 adenylate cyclase